jgi:hypothetical protein
MESLTLSSKCPLCGSGMTDYHESHSDGDSCRGSLLSNVCTSRSCGLPVRLWEKIENLKGDYARETWETR